MILKQELINIIQQLSDDQLEKVLDYIRVMFALPEKIELQLDEEQKELLDLLNDNIDSGRGDFAEKHDNYL